VEHIRLILLSVFIDLAAGNLVEDLIAVDFLRYAVEDDFILVLVVGVIEGSLTALDGLLCHILSLLDVAHVEKHSGVS
jgi:hypothetical protein